MDAERAYLFRHALLRDVAYALQLPQDRGTLHAVALEILLKLLPLPPDDSPHANDAFAAELALHAHLGAPDQEPALLQRGARFAQRSYQVSSAAAMYTRLARLPQATQEQRTDACIQAAKLSQSLGDVAASAEMLELAEGLVGDTPQQAQLRLEQAVHARKLGRLAQARELGEESLARYRRDGNRRGEAAALSSLGNVQGLQGLFDGAEVSLRDAVAILREVGEARSLGAALNNLADVLNQTGRSDEAWNAVAEARQLAVDSGDRVLEVVLRGHMATREARAGNQQQALVAMLEVIQLARELGDRRYEGLMLGNVAQCLADAGQASEAEQEFARSLQVCRETGNRNSEGVQTGNLGNMLRRAGRLQEAESTLRAASAIHAETGNRLSEAWTRGRLACAVLAAGRRAEAEELYESALAQTIQLNNQPDLEDLLANWQSARRAAGMEA